MRLAVICLGALALIGCGTDEAEERPTPSATPVTGCVPRMVLDFLDVGKPQQIALPDDYEVVDIVEELAEQLGDG